MEEIKKEYFCEKCNYKTYSQSSYYRHKKCVLHLTGTRKIRSDKVIMEPFKCSKCDFESKKEHNYISHNLNNHCKKEEREKQFPFFCNNCDFGCFTKSSYDIHADTNKHKMKANN